MTADSGDLPGRYRLVSPDELAEAVAGDDEDLYELAEVRRGGPDGELLRRERVPVPAVPAVQPCSVVPAGEKAGREGKARPVLGRKHPGDPVCVGDVLGHPMEPWERWARVVGIRKDACHALQRVTVRLYVNDEEPWPTGEYRTTGMCVAWEGTR